MILDDDSLNVLRKWLIKHLEPLSDAEPYVLANYVIALLRNDKPRPELRELCTSELEDFLKDETKQFVAKLFDALTDVEHKRYDNLLQEETHEPEQQEEDTERDHKHARRETPPPEGEERGRREEDERGEGEHKRRRDDDLSDEERGRYDKRYTRERQDNYDRDNNRQDNNYDRDRRRRYDDHDNKRGQGRSYGRGNDGGDRGGRRYPGQYNNNRDQRNGGPGGNPNQNAPLASQVVRQQRPQRCRDYDEKGYCMRGELCPYDHGTAPVVVTDVQELQKMNIVEPQPFQEEGYVPKRPRYDNQAEAAPYEQDMAYNPENPVFGVQQNFDRRRRLPPRNKLVGVPEDSIALQTIPLVPSAFQPHMTHGNAATTATGDKRRIVFDPSSSDNANTEYKRPFQQRFHNNNNNADSNSIVLHPTVNLNTNTPAHTPSHTPSQPHGGGFHPQAHGAQNFKDNSTLLITNIPPDLNTIDQLNAHFKKFGNLVNIQVKSQANKSYVQFSNHQEALRALRSVEAVLGNRFIKVFWSTSPSDSLPPSATPSTLPSPSLSSSPPSTLSSFSATLASLPTPLPSSIPVSAPALSTSLSANFASHNRSISAVPQTSALLSHIKSEEKTATAVPARPPPSRAAEAEITNQKKEKLLALQKKKEELRNQQIAQQKQMLEIMSKKLKAGNLSQAEKEDLMKTMKTSTDTLQELLQKESAALLQKKEQQALNKAQGIKDTIKLKEKEKLDRELDSISRSSSTLTSSTSSLTSSTGDASTPTAVASPPAPSLTSPSTSSSLSSALSSPPPALTSPTLKTSGDASSTLQHLQSLKKDLEQQAISMGLDPSLLHKIPTMGGRGRGARGAARGGAAGRGRGRGGGMSLDMRPTSLLVSGLPEDTNEAALRVHFQPFGELSSVEFPSAAMAVIQFADRFRAEAALAGAKQFKGQKLQMAWYNPQALKNAVQAQESKSASSEPEVTIKQEGETSDLSSSMGVEQDTEPYGHFDEEEEDTERSWKH